METPDSTPDSADLEPADLEPADLVPADPAAPPVPVDPAAAAASAQRLIEVIGELADFDVVFSSDADRQAVQEIVDLTSEEHRRALLIGLLLERIRPR